MLTKPEPPPRRLLPGRGPQRGIPVPQAQSLTPGGRPRARSAQDGVSLTMRRMRRSGLVGESR